MMDFIDVALDPKGINVVVDDGDARELMFDPLECSVSQNITMADDDGVWLKVDAGLEKVAVGRGRAEGFYAEWCCEFRYVSITECAYVPVVANHSVQQFEVGEKFPVAVSANHLIACVNNSHGIL